MKTGIRTSLAALVIAGMLSLGMGASGASAAEPRDTFEPYVVVNDYYWEETDIDGSRLMKESGTLLTLGFAYTHEFAGNGTIRPSAELFGGNVDYDGATQMGVPVRSTSRYIGGRIKGDVGQKFLMGQSSWIEPFAGLAYWRWTRTVEDSISADGTPAFGYSEDWTSVHARFGLRARAGLASSSALFAEGGVKVPIYNENYAHIGDGITLEPGKKVSYFGEAGVQVHAFKVSLTYDGQRYSQSDPSEGFVQPDSKSDSYGIKIGWEF